MLSELFAKEQGAFANWLPVFIGTGIGLYFSLPFEPSLLLSLIIFLILLSVIAALFYIIPTPDRNNVKGATYLLTRYILIAASLVSLGVVAATYRTDRIAAPIVERQFGPSYFEGRVVQIEPSSPGQRYLLDNLSGKAFKWLSTPHTMRLKSNLLQEDIHIGMRVRVLAVIQPPARPSIPGGFNYARHAYYQQIGAVGYVLGKAEILEDRSVKESPHFLEYMSMVIAETRNSIVRDVSKYIEGDQRDLVVTFLTGQKGGLSKETKEEIRNAGLAHLLAISGLHMGLMAGIVFFVIRFVLALFPSLALNYPIKKIAAVAAIVFCFFYLLLINHPLSAQRAFIMIAVSLGAVVFDRKALSIRTVSVAALFLLLIYPEVLISASFQMSFSAVLALVAFFEWYSHKNVEQHFVRKMLNGIKLTCYCSLVASIATAPFVLYHFHSLPLYGILANLVAVPFTAFVLMPLVLICYVSFPFGLEGWAIQLLGQAFEFLLWISRAISQIPYGEWRLSAFPVLGLVIVTLGGIWLCLFKTRLRWFGVIPVVFFVFFINMFSSDPDILVDPKGQLIGIAINDTLYLNNTRRSRFVARIWKQDLALKSVKSWEELPRTYLKCDEEACRIRLKGVKISFVKNGTAFLEECNQGQLLVVPGLKIPRWCRENGADHSSLSLDKWGLRKGGVHSISIMQGTPNIQKVNKITGDRPWSRSE